MGRNIAMKSLMKGLDAKQMCWRSCGCCRSFAQPIHIGCVIGSCPYRLFPYVAGVGYYGVMGHISAQFEVTVTNGAVRAVKGDDVALYGSIERFAP